MFRRVLGIVLVGTLVAFAIPASVGAGNGLSVELESPSAPLTFRLEIASFDCDPGTFAVLEVLDGNSDPVTPLSVVEDPTDPNVALMTLSSNTVPGEITVEAECSDGETTPNFLGASAWHSIAVTKAVTGTPPPGTTFTVNVACEAFDLGELAAGDYGAADVPPVYDVDLVYPAGGGLGFVYGDQPFFCEITEPVTGGARAVTIDPEVLTIGNPEQFAVTVTNVFGLSFTG